jgi:hypothetical protein
VINDAVSVSVEINSYNSTKIAMRPQRSSGGVLSRGEPEQPPSCAKRSECKYAENCCALLHVATVVESRNHRTYCHLVGRRPNFSLQPTAGRSLARG